MRNYQKILQILTAPERKKLFFIFGLMLVGMILETMGIGMIIPVLSIMTNPDLIENNHFVYRVFGGLGALNQVQMIIVSLIVMTGFYLFKTVFLMAMVWKQNAFVRMTQAAISLRLFTGYLRQPFCFHLRRNSSQLIQNVTNESAFFSQVLLSGTTLVVEGLVLVGIVSFLLFCEPVGAFVVMSTIAVITWSLQHLLRPRILAWGKARQYHDSLRLQHLTQGLCAIKDVKILGCETEFLTQYDTHNLATALINSKQEICAQLPRLWLELFAVGSLTTLVFIMLFQHRPLAALVPELGVFAVAAFRVLPSTHRMIGAFQTLRFYLPVMDKLFEELQALSVKKVIQPSTAGTTTAFQHDIVIHQIGFQYEGAKSHAIQDLCCSIQKGQSVGIMGASGSGKSTLIDIILGLLPPNQGQILVDGVDIQSDLRHWQNQIGYVSQTIFLTDDSIRRNVAFGIADELIDDIAVRQAIDFAQLEHVVECLPEGLETVIGERGVRLSGGQRQRIGIARALYHNPSVLVLDEATSALDTETETDIMHAINGLRGQKTLIIVAHRLSTIASCDWLLKLHEGRLVAEGTYASIIKDTHKTQDDMDAILA